MSDISTSILLITVFKNVVKDSVISSFLSLISELKISENINAVMKLYSDFVSKLYDKDENQNLYAYLKHLIYTDENILSKGCGVCIKENDSILNTAEYELSLFDELLKYDYSYICSVLNSKFSKDADLIKHLPAFYIQNKVDFDIQDILNSYSQNGYGIFSCNKAFRFLPEGEILPVKYFDEISFNDLKNYDYQKDVIKQNTKAFLEGKAANNILLYGDRGCGKSSAVKALIKEFENYNLKIVQISKEGFVNLTKLYDKLRNLPLKFIIFADDISFNEEDDNFSSIKAALEGSLIQKPVNTIIYATTNRMHLVKESFSAREGNEVHYNDTLDEMSSLSDRFGIMLTFSSLNKDEYIDIVYKIAQDCCIQTSEDLKVKALQFAALKGLRTPRVARQFIVDYIANS